MGVKYPSVMAHTPPKRQSNQRVTLPTLTVLSAYFHVLMEWLFFITKPSSLSTLSLAEKIKVLTVSGGVYALMLLAGSVILSIPALLTRTPGWKARLAALPNVPSAFMFSVTALILLDNFTYTLFKFGIITTLGAWRIVYIAIFLLVFWRMFRFVKRARQTLGLPASFLSLGLLVLSMSGIFAIYYTRAPYMSNLLSGTTQTSAKRPNILILGADGLSAGYLSVYGYKNETTPFLTGLAETSLLAENAFPNASSTTASTASAMTGKEPATAGVYRYPDILSGEDSFEHLPGILKHQGYRTVQIGTPYYVDAEQLNMLDGFDLVNTHSTRQPALNTLRAVLGNSPSTYFIQTITARFGERLLHAFFLKEMRNPFKEVNNPKVRMTDSQRVDQIISLLEESDRPLFVFAHFMDTHGPVFSSEKDAHAHGSTNSEQEWDVGLYEQAIRSYDGHVQEIYDYLARSGKLDNTLLVIYTDHGFKYVVNQRIPLLLRFPNGEHAGLRKNNVETIDLPVTLLDYLGIPRPEWMTGTSMLGEEPPADRRIISVVGGSPKKILPPFFQVKIVQVIVCQKWYSLNVQENAWKSGQVRGHTAPCTDELLPGESEIRQTILDYLEGHGYDIRSLQE